MELITVTRATTATFCNSSGALATAAAGVARIDFDPVTRLSKGLLIEEERTNLLLRSQEIDHASWTKVAATCAGAAINARIAPDLTVTMDKLEEDSTNAAHYCSQGYAKTSSSEVQAYALSCWAVAGERSVIRLVQQGNGSGNRASADFDLVNGIANTAVSAGGYDSALAWIEPWGGGLFRLCLTLRINNDGQANTTSYALLKNAVGGSDDYAGTTGFGAYLWGLQLEKGPFPTSYVPTTTGAVTRNVDDIRIASLSPWLEEEAAGTIIADYSVPWTYSALDSVSRRIVEIDDGTANNRHLVYLSGGKSSSLTTTAAAGVAGGTGAVDHAARGVVGRIGWAWSANNFARAVDGSLQLTDSAGAVPGTLSECHLGASSGAATALCGHLRRLRFIPRRVSNTELQQLTKAA